jgi:hypothetical protein
MQLGYRFCMAIHYLYFQKKCITPWNQLATLETTCIYFRIDLEFLKMRHSPASHADSAAEAHIPACRSGTHRTKES